MLEKVVFVSLVVIALSGSMGTYLSWADGKENLVKNNQQDTRIALVEQNTANVIGLIEAQNLKLEKLIDISTATNLSLKTHIAGTK